MTTATILTVLRIGTKTLDRVHSYLDTFCSSAPMCYLYEIFLPPDTGSGSRKYMVNLFQRLLFCFSLHLAFFADAGFHSSIILVKVGKS